MDVSMLQVENLCLRAGEFELRDVSVNVGPQEYFVLMGPTGSGKSLFVKCVCGLIRPTAGKICIEDKEITFLEPRFRRIGYVPQDGALFPHMDVAKNVTFSLRVRGLSQAKALKQLEPLIETLSLQPLLERSTMNLSGGERQKVALARALAGKPKLLILDEPVSALDQPTQREVCGELRRVQRQLGIPIVHICHNVVEARYVSDCVGVLVQGRLVQTGPLDDLISKPTNDAVERLLKT